MPRVPGVYGPRGLVGGGHCLMDEVPLYLHVSLDMGLCPQIGMNSQIAAGLKSHVFFQLLSSEYGTYNTVMAVAFKKDPLQLSGCCHFAESGSHTLVALEPPLDNAYGAVFLPFF